MFFIKWIVLLGCIGNYFVSFVYLATICKKHIDYSLRDSKLLKAFSSISLIRLSSRCSSSNLSRFLNMSLKVYMINSKEEKEIVSVKEEQPYTIKALPTNQLANFVSL